MSEQASEASPNSQPTSAESIESEPAYAKGLDKMNLDDLEEERIRLLEKAQNLQALENDLTEDELMRLSAVTAKLRAGRSPQDPPPKRKVKTRRGGPTIEDLI